MKSTLVFLLFLFSISLPTVQADDQRYYDVEILIFQNLKDQNQSESWPQTASVVQPESYVELGLPYAGELPEGVLPEYSFVPLEEEAYKLEEEAKLLDESDRYRVLMHLGWRQPGLPEGAAVPVRIERLVPALIDPETAENPLPGVAGGDPMVMLEGSAPPVTRSPAALESRPALPHRLEGYVKIMLSRYLHIHADLGFQEEGAAKSWEAGTLGVPVAPEDTQGQMQANVPFYHLLQTRKMRRKELHYLDHPVLGVMVIITPFELPEQPEQPAATAPYTTIQTTTP